MNQRTSAQVVALVVRGRIILWEVGIQLEETAPFHLLVELGLIVGVGKRLVGLIAAIINIIIFLADPIDKLVTVFGIIHIVVFVFLFIVVVNTDSRFFVIMAHPDFSVADLHRPARLHKQRQNQSSIYLTDSVEEERQVRDAMQFCPEALDARVKRLSRCVGDKGLVIVE